MARLDNARLRDHVESAITALMDSDAFHEVIDVLCMAIIDDLGIDEDDESSDDIQEIVIGHFFNGYVIDKQTEIFASELRGVVKKANSGFGGEGLS